MNMLIYNVKDVYRICSFKKLFSETLTKFQNNIGQMFLLIQIQIFLHFFEMILILKCCFSEQTDVMLCLSH